MGLIAHTCVEATVRFGAELGYEITMVKDANYATAVLPADEVVDAISS
jgi:ureidoacrylate peracid hydrolase